MTAGPTLVLDSPSLVYRAFFALPATIRSPLGGSVNAVRLAHEGRYGLASAVYARRRGREIARRLRSGRTSINSVLT
ncbi:MAG: hypothetical protein NVS3B18_04540 [Candidatus Dormibacteria bacterium]